MRLISFVFIFSKLCNVIYSLSSLLPCYIDSNNPIELPYAITNKRKDRRKQLRSVRLSSFRKTNPTNANKRFIIKDIGYLLASIYPTY